MRKYLNRGLIRATAAGCLALSLAGCAPLPAGDASSVSDESFTNCEDLLPGAVGKDILGDSELIQVTEVAKDPEYPYVNEMVTDGLACGLDEDTVFVGQLAMDETRWEAVHKELLADGAEQAGDDTNIPGFVILPKPGGGQPADAGIAWHDGTLYYSSTAFFFMVAPILTY